MIKKRYIRAILSILGIAGIVVFLLFPSEVKYECLEHDLNFYPYGDSASGIDFIEFGRDGFKCKLSRGNGLCGFGLSFFHGNDKSTRNWNLMDSLKLDIQSSSNFKELIVQILTVDPDHTNLEDRSTMKPLIKEIRLKPDEKHYSIYMEHFYTPDYWFEQQKATERGNFKRYSAVAGIEIFSGWRNSADEFLEIKIDDICAEGQNNAPFAILVCYLTVLIIAAISVRTK